MRCVIRRRGLSWNLPGLSYIHGNRTPHVGLARIFRTRREAMDDLSTGEFPEHECEVAPFTTTGGYWELGPWG
jgi:hypothetical protein